MRIKLWINLWLVYLIWGSTYLGIALAVKDMPPFYAMGTRFLFAATLLGTWLTLKNGFSSLRVSFREFVNVSVMGGVLLGGAIGSVAVTEQYAPSGIVALIISLLPVWILIMRSMTGDRPTKFGLVGVAIGLVGVAILLKPGSIAPISGVSTGTMIGWCFVALLGNIGWAIGSFLAPRYAMPKSAYVSTFYQLLAGGIVLTAVAIITGESFSQWRSAGAAAWWSWLYLVVIGSIVAYSAYFWLVQNAPISLTSTYAYVNPVIAVALGVVVLKERINASYLIGGAVIVLGVLLVVSNETKKRT